MVAVLSVGPSYDKMANDIAQEPVPLATQLVTVWAPEPAACFLTR